MEKFLKKKKSMKKILKHPEEFSVFKISGGSSRRISVRIPNKKLNICTTKFAKCLKITPIIVIRFENVVLKVLAVCIIFSSVWAAAAFTQYNLKYFKMISDSSGMIQWVTGCFADF